ncbi:hypothetical protein Y032_0023g829 [Ancylostoma ceylanicum]|uniref:Uncharacterized protein n=1 Tax=Ancylostoma ceylanicum TaxID=53326 RepID=A0A016UZ27_9BILA|nr:hypothetical protein Y032_0023g829 [Ancylostoma ceylanicum]
MSTALSIDTADKIAVNGCDLLNRHELSSTQDRELQRYIDNNAHILYYKDRELPSPPKRRQKSNYGPLSRSLSQGESPALGYNRSDYNHYSPRNGYSYSQYSSSRPATPIANPFVTPTGQRVNFTSDFPELGDGSRLDDGFSPSYKPTPYSSPYGTMNTNGGYSTFNTNGGYPNLGRGGISKNSRPPSPYGSLKSRKGVSWLDQERARSLSPANNKLQTSTYCQPCHVKDQTIYVRQFAKSLADVPVLDLGESQNVPGVIPNFVRGTRVFYGKKEQSRARIHERISKRNQASKPTFKSCASCKYVVHAIANHSSLIVGLLGYRIMNPSPE